MMLALFEQSCNHNIRQLAWLCAICCNDNIRQLAWLCAICCNHNIRQLAWLCAIRSALSRDALRDVAYFE